MESQHLFRLPPDSSGDMLATMRSLRNGSLTKNLSEICEVGILNVSRLLYIRGKVENMRKKRGYLTLSSKCLCHSSTMILYHGYNLDGACNSLRFEKVRSLGAEAPRILPFECRRHVSVYRRDRR